MGVNENMLKVVGSILVIFGCAAIGFYMVERMKRHVNELEQVKKQLLFMEGEVRVGFRTVKDIFAQLEQRTEGNWKAFYSYLQASMEKEKQGALEQIWMEGIRETLKNSLLNHNEKRAWKELGENLGYLDKEMQIALLHICQEHFEEYRIQAEEYLKRNAKIYQTLGIMGGIFLTIIFV